MPCHPSAQAWFDGHILDDTVFAAAYGFLTGRARAVLKKCIARQHQVWGESPLTGEEARRTRQGFGVRITESPAPYSFVLCERGYGSAPAFLAAVMPALLAAVDPVVVCFSGVIPGTPSVEHACPPEETAGVSPALLASLELAGVERAYAADEEDALGIFRGLSGRDSNGRLIILGGVSFGSALAYEAHQRSTPCRSLTGCLRYFSGSLNSVVEQHGSPAGEIHGVPLTGAGPEPSLRLEKGHEDIWFWPDLGPVWFRNRRMHFFSS